MTPENHDAAFAAVSHLPHLLAFAYFSAVRQPAGRARLPVAGRPWLSRLHAHRRQRPDDLARHPDGQPRRSPEAVAALPPHARRAGARHAGRATPRPCEDLMRSARRRPCAAGRWNARDGHSTLGPARRAQPRRRHVRHPLPRPAAAARAPPARCGCRARRASPTACCCWPAWREGTTRVHDLLDSDDTQVMLDALRALGCAHRARRAVGSAARASAARRPAAVHERRRCSSATPAPRCARWPRRWRCWRPRRAGASSCRGVPRMHERPIGDLVDALRRSAATIDDLGQPGYPAAAVARPGRAAR